MERLRDDLQNEIHNLRSLYDHERGKVQNANGKI